MEIDHRLAEQEFGLAEESLGSVGLNSVDTCLIGRDVVQIYAEVNLLALIINLAGSRSNHCLSIVAEGRLGAVGEEDSLGILDPEVNPDRTLRGKIVLNQAEGSEEPDDPAASVGHLVGTVVCCYAESPGLDNGTGGHLTGEALLVAASLRAAAASAVSLWFNVLRESIWTI